MSYVTNTQMKTIAKKIGSVTSSLDKRVSLLEEMAKDDLYTTSTDSTTALVKQIPAKGLSNFYLNNVGGCVTKCSNVFDFYNAEWVKDSDITYTVSSNKLVITNGSTTVKERIGINIPVVSSKSYTLSFTYSRVNTGSDMVIGWVGCSKIIQLSSSQTSGTISTTFSEITTSYFSIYVSEGETLTITNIRLNEGSTAKAYEKYYAGLSYNYPQSVEMYGKNLINPSDYAVYNVSTQITSGYSMSYDNDIITFTNNGTYTNISAYFPVYLEAGTYYHNYTKTSGNYTNIRLYNAVEGSIVGDISASGNSVTITTAGTYYYRICLASAGMTVSIKPSLSTINSYSAYNKTTLQSAEMWSKIAERVGDLSLGYLDEATGKWVQEKYSYTFTGNETLVSAGADDRFYFVLPVKALNSPTITMITDSDYTDYGDWVTMTNYDKSSYSNGTNLYIRNSNISIASELLADIKGKTFAFYLATSITTDISDILEDCGIETNAYGQVCRGAEGGGTVVITTNTGLAVPSDDTFLIKTV